MKAPFSLREQDVLRRLAGQYAETAHHPDAEQRRLAWKDHNAMRTCKPLILAEPENSWFEILPDAELACTDPFARFLERELRQKLFRIQEIKDDRPYDPFIDLPWYYTTTGFGVEIHRMQTSQQGSFAWSEFPLKNLAEDLSKLSFRQVSVDRERTLADKERAEKLFGDLLGIRIRGYFWWSLGMTREVIELMGLENFMLAMYDDPDHLHKLMAFMRDEHLHFIMELERNGLFTGNNKDNGIASGGIGYTDELPGKEHVEGTPFRLLDTWGFAESQETVGVSPDMFGEFVFPYQLPILEKFGLNCYGCCEPLEKRMKYVRNIPRLRRVSVSPWADQEKMADECRGRFIFSRKPHPALIIQGFDENAIRADLRKTFQCSAGCTVEIIMKDLNTISGEPERIGRWVALAKEERERMAGG
jgi:hypothetical protein